MTIALPQPPADGISRLKYSPIDPYLLACSSWDRQLRLYNTKTTTAKTWKFSMPLLDVRFSKDGTSLYTGGLDKSLGLIDITTQTLITLGSHEEAIKEIVALDNQIITGSWDKSCKIWDTRSENPLVDTLIQPDKVFAMDAVDHYLVVGLANRTNQIYDTRNLMEPLYVRESSLKHMTRIIACIPDGSGYAIGSIEGRVAVDYFDPNEKVQASKFSFKCHREKVDQTEMIYPVNALAFHPIQKKSFASGGGDGIVSIWDGTQKKRLRNLPPFPTSISSLDFNCTGTALAIAVSYTYEQGEKEYALINNSHAPDAIHIKDIAESDVTPRIKTR